MANVIKTIKKKSGNTFSDYLISTDAKLIDTFSGLDLESLFKLGESSYKETKTTLLGEVITEYFGNNIIPIFEEGNIIDVSITEPYYKIVTSNENKQEKNIITDINNQNKIVVGNEDPHTPPIDPEDPDLDTYLIIRQNIQINYQHIVKRLYYNTNFIARKDIYKNKRNNIEEIIEKISFQNQEPFN